MFILVENNQFIREVDLSVEYPNRSFPSPVKQSDLPENIFICRQSPRPQDPTINYIPMTPILVNNEWVQMWDGIPVNEVELQTRIKNKWAEIREERDRRMTQFDWRVLRNQRETRLGLVPSESITSLDSYMLSLVNVTLQPDPFNVTWPQEPPFEESAPQLVIVPQSVSKAQGRFQLKAEGLLSAVESFIYSLPVDADIRMAYESAGTWDRSSPSVIGMLQMLNKDDTDADTFFINAFKIKL